MIPGTRAGWWAAAMLVAPVAARGQGFARVDSIANAGIRQGVYPGAVLVLGRRDTVLLARGYGRLTWSPRAPRPTVDSTLWDAASLTKVVATTSAVMRLNEEGKLDLDRPVASYLPRFAGTGKDSVTVRMLLDHTSGLPSYVPFFQRAPGRDSAIALLYREPLRRPPGATAEYSDLGFMILGLLVEKLSGEPLDQFAAREVFSPLGMDQTRFRPPSALHERVAPTGTLEGSPVAGTVNDQNAARLGGTAGHAGLFTTGRDLGRFAQLWLGGGALDGRQVFQATTISTFLRPEPGAGTRVLGWETPDPADRHDTYFGHYVSNSAFGHTGWTGTELWIDPARNLFLIFLTNRSYRPRVPRSIARLRHLRGALADAVVRAVPGACEAPVEPACP
jgi:CubicO group peptidase (beta-lactamase class C family)